MAKYISSLLTALSATFQATFYETMQECPASVQPNFGYSVDSLLSSIYSAIQYVQGLNRYSPGTIQITIEVSTLTFFIEVSTLTFFMAFLSRIISEATSIFTYKLTGLEVNIFTLAQGK